MGWFSKNNQKAVINFIDLDNDLMSIGESVEVTGQTGEEIDYDPSEAISKLEGQGYVLVRNKFDGDGEKPKFTDDTEVFLISFKHGERKVDREHPLTKIPSEEYMKPFTFKVIFEGTPTKVKDHVETIYESRTLTADKVTNKQIPNGQFDTDWKLEKEKFDDVEMPVLPGAHTDKKVVEGPEVGDEDVEVTVNYEPNGHLIPVDENGDEIPDVGPYRFASDKEDPTKVAENQIVPDLEGYTHEQETISPKEPGKDVVITYEKIPVKDNLYIGEQEDAVEESDAVESPATESTRQVAGEEANESEEKGVQRRLGEQMAIVNFIDLDKDGKQITSSGPLYGLPGEVINDLYSTEVPMKAIKDAGFEVVFNNFDGKDQVQKFNNNHLLTQIFTVGLRHKRLNGKMNDTKLDSYEETIKNYVAGDDTDANESEAVIKVASATMELLNMFIEKNNKNVTAKKEKNAETENED